MKSTGGKKRKWVDVAKKRILNILTQRRVCSRTQLETKISESGPTYMRPEPIFITQALKELSREDIIVKLEDKNQNLPPFFAHSTFDPDNQKDKDRLELIKKLYNKYKTLASKVNNCGNILEIVVYESARECNSFVISGAPGNPPHLINGHNFQEIGWPEYVFMFSATTKPISSIVECKNIRKWLYPESHEIWELLNKACKAEMVPILITRKIAHPVRFLFKSIGAIGFEMHRQYFSPHLKEEMEDIVHKDKLGFHNIYFSLEKEDRLINFFDNTVRKQIDILQATFLSVKDTLVDYAEELSNVKLPSYKRIQIYREVFKEFVRPEWKEEYKDQIPDEYL
ncbi:MAG: hypothetical protein AB1767_06965 [Bacillota bacterium]